MKLHQITYQSPIGPIIIVAHQQAICLVDFVDGKHLPKHLQDLLKIYGDIAETPNQLCLTGQEQLSDYFAGKRQEFDLPLAFTGSDFQQKVWQSLQQIPYAKTISYAQQAHNIQKPKAVRAVANANAQNKIAIVVPCHRIIGSNGKLTGYASGTDKKAFLLDLERENRQ